MSSVSVPAELEPFDFTRANATPSLWLAEGFYPILRAAGGGARGRDAAGRLYQAIVGHAERPDQHARAALWRTAGDEPARPLRRCGPVDRPDQPQYLRPYYPYGAVIALALDLELRQHFPQLSLDDYMRSCGATTATRSAAIAPMTCVLRCAGDGGPGLCRPLLRAQRDRQRPARLRAAARTGGLTLRAARPGKAWAGPSPIKGDAACRWPRRPRRARPFTRPGSTRRPDRQRRRHAGDHARGLGRAARPSCPGGQTGDRLPPTRRRAERDADPGRRSHDGRSSAMRGSARR